MENKMAKILLVEDEVLVRDMYKKKLELSKFDVETASDGKEGLRKARELKPDLILLDIIMPHLDGIQVLINLVGNAIQFTEIGGVVISHRFEYKKIVTDVVDTGVGIPTQTREILFKKFLIVRRSLTRNYQEGTGLGLYISRLLMREMGGDVWLERSELEHGSTFSFSVPRA